MRFRGRISPSSFHILKEVIQSLSKLGKTATLCLSPDQVFFSMKDPGGEDVQGFATLQSNILFAEYILQSRANDHIAFHFAAQNLVKALQSAKRNCQVSMRLLKKDQRSFLNVKMRAVDSEVLHDIPIDVISMRVMDNFREPLVPTPTVQLELPQQLQALRSNLDRFKHFHKVIFVSASMEGNLSVKGSTDAVTTETSFRHLPARHDLTDENDPENANQARVAVDSKQFSKAIHLALNKDPSNATHTALCCIAEGHAIVLHNILYDGLGSITFFIPVLNVEMDV